MWARYIELILAAWLLASPWLFGGEFATSLACGIVTLVLAGLSFRTRWRRMHLGLLGVAAWLIAGGWLATRAADGAPPSAQNEILVGLVLATFAIVPSDALRPPATWRAQRALDDD